MTSFRSNTIAHLLSVALGAWMVVAGVPEMASAQTTTVEDGCIWLSPQNCSGWSPLFRPADASGPERVVVSDDGTVFIYGREMLSTTGLASKSVLRWTGSHWQSIGSPDEDVDELIVDPSGRLVAAGKFERISGVGAKHIAAWDGQSWEALESGYSERVLAVTSLQDGTLVVGGGWMSGGPFRIGVTYSVEGGLHAWDGSAWSTLLNKAHVLALASAPDGTVYCSLTEGAGGGWIIGRIAPGSTALEVLGSGKATSLSVHSSGRLFASVDETPEGGPRGVLRSWDGTAWRSEGFVNSTVHGHSDQVWASTYSDDTLRVLKYDSGGWALQGPPVVGRVVDVHAHADHGVFVAGGPFSTPNRPVNTVARLKAGAWESFEDSTTRLGLAGTGGVGVGDLEISSQGGVYVGGQFTLAGADTVNHVALFRDGRWHRLGEGLDGRVRGLYEDPSGGLYVGGGFRSSGRLDLPGVARWENGRWHSFGALKLDPSEAEFADFIAFLRSSDGTLYGAGLSHSPGRNQKGFFARKQGADWKLLGTTWGNESGQVRTLAEASDGSILLGGSFEGLEGPGAKNVVRWNGQEFTPVAPLNGFVRELLVYRGDVYAGGDFLQSGPTATVRIARLVGNDWQPLGLGLSGRLQDMSVGRDGWLYVAGNFEWAGQTKVDGMARWDGQAWLPTDAPTKVGRLRKVAVDSLGTVYIGGSGSEVFTNSAFTIWRPERRGPSEPTEFPNEISGIVGAYPNPTSGGSITVVLSVAEGQLELFDMMGRRVGHLRITHGKTHHVLEMSALSPGVYFLRLLTSELAVTRPIVVSR